MGRSVFEAKATTMTTAFYTHPACLLHEMGKDHPESPARLQAIEDQLIASRIDQFLERRDAPAAEMEDIARAHTANAIALIRDKAEELHQGKAGQSEEGTPLQYYPLDSDTLLNEYSWTAALHAAGAAVAATDAILSGELENAFCAVRPPGHHATPTTPMGFCLLNNVAIAALHALNVHGLERIAIVDFDVHHGNGTEAIFEQDSRVLLVNFFQHPFFPFTGAESIQPHIVNLPFPAYTTGATVRQQVLEKWLPALHAHRPQMIFISAGFDAHREDDMGQMGLVEADYTWLTQQVMEVATQYAQRRIVSCLEGGYNLSALGRSVVAHVKVLADLE